MCGESDDRQRRITCRNDCGKLVAVHFGHLDIAEHHVAGATATVPQPLERGTGALEAFQRSALLLQQPGEHQAVQRVVVHDHQVQAGERLAGVGASRRHGDILVQRRRQVTGAKGALEEDDATLQGGGNLDRIENGDVTEEPDAQFGPVEHRLRHGGILVAGDGHHARRLQHHHRCTLEIALEGAATPLYALGAEFAHHHGGLGFVHAMQADPGTRLGSARRLRRNERDAHLEAAPLARLAAHLDEPSHRSHQPLRDRKPQAGAAEATRGRTVRLLERREDATDLLGRHAHAAVADNELEAPRTRLRLERYAATLGELDRVGEQIDQHLGESLRVADASRGQHRLAHRETQPFRLRIQRAQRDHPIDDLSGTHWRLLDEQLACLDLGEIQHIVDHAEQMTSGFDDAPIDLGRLAPPRFPLPDLGKTENRVQRGADLVAHVGEKFAARLRRSLRLETLRLARQLRAAVAAKIENHDEDRDQRHREHPHRHHDRPGPAVELRFGEQRYQYQWRIGHRGLDQRGCMIGVSQAGRVDRRHKSSRRLADQRLEQLEFVPALRPRPQDLARLRLCHRDGATTAGIGQTRVDRGEIGARGDMATDTTPGLHRRGEQQPFTSGQHLHRFIRQESGPRPDERGHLLRIARGRDEPARIVDKDEGGVDRLLAESLAGNELIEACLDRLDVHTQPVLQRHAEIEVAEIAAHHTRFGKLDKVVAPLRQHIGNRAGVLLQFQPMLAQHLLLELALHIQAAPQQRAEIADQQRRRKGALAIGFQQITHPSPPLRRTPQLLAGISWKNSGR